jgi:hypothetical protein
MTVAYAAAMPTVPTGTPNFSDVMVEERGAREFGGS